MKRQKSGFTLIELIVSLTIFSMLLGGIYFALGIELSFWKRVVGICEDQQIKNMVLLRIVRDLRGAEEILPLSNNKTLAVKVGGNTLEYTLKNKKIRRKKNNYSAYLTTKGEFSTRAFEYPTPKLVKIEIEDWTTTVFLRN